jgi:hypothetical protein
MFVERSFDPMDLVAGLPSPVATRHPRQERTGRCAAPVWRGVSGNARVKYPARRRLGGELLPVAPPRWGHSSWPVMPVVTATSNTIPASNVVAGEILTEAGAGN